MESVGRRLMQKCTVAGKWLPKVMSWGWLDPFPDLETPHPLLLATPSLGPWSWSGDILSAQVAAGCGPLVWSLPQGRET